MGKVVKEAEGNARIKVDCWLCSSTSKDIYALDRIWKARARATA